MHLFCLPEYNDIITDVDGSWYVSNLLTDDVLEDFACRVGAEVQPRVPPQAVMSCKRGDIPALWS